MSDYQIQPGDTLSKIAKQYGVTVKQLQEANGIKNPNLIFAGKSLKIPIEDENAFKDIPGLSIQPDKGGDARPLYGLPVTPSGGGAVPLYAAPIKPDTSGGAVPLYAAPIKPDTSGGAVPLYAAPIKPDTSGGAVPLYAAPIKPDTSDGGAVPLYAAPIRFSPSIKPSDLTPLIPKDPAGPEKPAEPAKPAPPKKPVTPLTPEQKKAAQTMGKYVARYLAGYTTDQEQEAIINNVNKVTNSNVQEFLSSYEAHRNDEMVHAEPFFSQVLHEYSFDEKQDIMKRVALRLAGNLAETGNSKDAARIRAILKKNEISEKDAALLDKIYQHNLEMEI